MGRNSILLPQSHQPSPNYVMSFENFIFCNREGLQLHGQRYSWTDPAAFILENWPWWTAHDGQLSSLKPEDVGYDLSRPGSFTMAATATSAETASHSSRPTSSSGTGSNSGEDSDPLFNMLLHLQEAANNDSFGSNE